MPIDKQYLARHNLFVNTGGSVAIVALGDDPRSMAMKRVVRARVRFKRTTVLRCFPVGFDSVKSSDSTSRVSQAFSRLSPAWIQ